MLMLIFLFLKVLVGIRKIKYSIENLHQQQRGNKADELKSSAGIKSYSNRRVTCVKLFNCFELSTRFVAVGFTIAPIQYSLDISFKNDRNKRQYAF